MVNVPDDQVMVSIVRSDAGVHESVLGRLDLCKGGRFEAGGEKPCCIRMSWRQSFVDAFPDVRSKGLGGRWCRS